LKTVDDVFFLELKKQIDTALSRKNGHPPVVVLDLAPFKHIDSRGLGSLLLEADRLTSSGGKLKIVNAAPQMIELMRLVGVDHFLEVNGNSKN
jgi:anti-anti-sigma factor